MRAAARVRRGTASPSRCDLVTERGAHQLHRIRRLLHEELEEVRRSSAPAVGRRRRRQRRRGRTLAFPANVDVEAARSSPAAGSTARAGRREVVPRRREHRTIRPSSRDEPTTHITWAFLLAFPVTSTIVRSARLPHKIRDERRFEWPSWSPRCAGHRRRLGSTNRRRRGGPPRAADRARLAISPPPAVLPLRDRFSVGPARDWVWILPREVKMAVTKETISPSTPSTTATLAPPRCRSHSSPSASPPSPST
jgi:hypothetical protein